MKKFLLPVIVFSYLLTSCTADEITTDANKDTQAIEQAVTATNAHKDARTPDNAANAYDATGKLMNEVYKAVMLQTAPQTFSAAVTATENAAQANQGFTSISQGYAGLTDAQVQWVTDNFANAATIINSTGASVNGRQKLTDLLALVESLQGQSYDAVYNGIANFEQTVGGNATLTDKDKQMVLIASSVARYECYGGGPGKPWLNIKSHILAGIKGADAGMPLAITLSAAVKALQP